MNRRLITGVQVSIAMALACAVGACKSGEKSGSGSAVPSAKVNPAPLQAQAALPPPPNATKATSIGKGAASIQTGNGAGDTDSFWVGQLDIDGDGDVETTQFLWDDEDKVLFAYAETEVACENGGTSVVAILAGVNAAGNSRGRPVGSGFYAVYFDGTECGADQAGLFGCTFTASGYVNGWAAVVVDSAGDEIDMVGVN